MGQPSSFSAPRWQGGSQSWSDLHPDTGTLVFVLVPPMEMVLVSFVESWHRGQHSPATIVTGCSQLWHIVAWHDWLPFPLDSSQVQFTQEFSSQWSPMARGTPLWSTQPFGKRLSSVSSHDTGSASQWNLICYYIVFLLKKLKLGDPLFWSSLNFVWKLCRMVGNYI